ncbi:LamG domain-containing protein [Chloroflexota bacterium]
MTWKVLWQQDCPGQIETELVDGVIRVTCYTEDVPPPVARVVDGVQVLYTFREGGGGMIHDVSGVGAPLELIVESEAATTWLPDGGLSVNSPTVIASSDAAAKVFKMVKKSSQITVEAWIKPASPTQDGPARIATLSSDFHHRNVHLAQAGALYDVRLRTTETTVDGQPSLSTPPGSVTGDLTHVVYTREASGMAKVYMNAVAVAEKDIGGDFSSWDLGYRLALANELLGSRAWLGEYHLVAIYSRALNADEITQNYQAFPRGA